MTDEVEICNTALSLLGQTYITSLEDRTQTAQICKQVYAPLRDAVLESRMWSFAIYRLESTSTQAPGRVDGVTGTYAENGYPEWGNGFVHSIPDDFMTVFRVYRDVSGSMPIDAVWTKEGNYIISDSSTIYMWGVKRVTNPNLFSPLFVQALAARIAMDLCIPITGSKTLYEQMTMEYDKKLQEGQVRDGQQGRNESTRSNRILSVRAR
jgi:hypothetical protein